ncbi:MAG: GatB/YqeY domain-containing protein [Vicingaceae bacterium]
MSIADQINNDIKQAMLAKEKEKLEALRAIKAALLLEATKGGNSEVTDDIAQQIIQKLHKQRKESAAIYIEQNRQDLADAELFQAKVLEAYLPEQMDEDAIRKEVMDAIAKTGASSPQDMGKVMGMLMGKLKGKADGSLISKIVKEALN